jgi:hypothetical protein
MKKMEQWGKSMIYLGGWPDRRTYRGLRWKDTERYRSAVRIQLNSIHTTQAGTILIKSISKRVLIVPVDESVPATDKGSLMGSARSIESIDLINYPKHPRLPSIGSDGDPTLMPNAAAKSHPNADADWNDNVPMNWAGSECLIQFTPGFYYKNSALYQDFGSDFTADAMLFHELVHASRGTRGVVDRLPTIGDLGRGDTMGRYTNHDEFVAILLTNIYRSERHPGSNLRRSHFDTFQKYHNPGDFQCIEHFQESMDRFFLQSPSLSRDFAYQVRAPFNPIRDYYGKVTLKCR